MKKILYTSTALVAAGLFTAGAASASDKIDLTLGGYSKWWVVGAWNSDAYTASNGGGAQPTTFSNGTGREYTNVDVKGQNQVWFGGKTTLDNGMKVGVDIHLQAGGSTGSTTDTIDKSYVYIQGGFGEFMVGTQANGTALLHVQAPDAASNWGGGGIMTGNSAIAKPWHVNEMAGGNTTAIATTGNSEALTYVAPTFYGLTAGASYLPHGGQTGITPNQNGNSFSLNTSCSPNQGGCNSALDFGAAPASWVAPIKEVYGAGALYANTFGGVGVKVSAGAVTAQLSQGLGVKDWFEQAYGTQLSYAGFTLGGSYRHQQANYGGGVTGQLGNGVGGLDAVDLGALGQQSATGNGSFGNGSAMDIGLQYATGPYGVSFDYFYSAVDHCYLGTGDSSAAAELVGGSCKQQQNGGAFANGKDQVNMYQLSGKYNLGAGVDILGSAGYAVYQSARGAAAAGVADSSNNSGWTVMSGLSLTF